MSITPKISIVAAIGNGRLHNRVLGKDNELLWRIPDDLKRFRELTRGHPVIMGRKTFESIVAATGGPLSGRPNIVITRDPNYQAQSLVPSVDTNKSLSFVSSIEEALAAASTLDSDEIFVIGGGQIYAAALPYVDKLYLTLIDDDKEGDSFFLAYEDQFTTKTFEEDREWNGLKYRWVDLER